MEKTIRGLYEQKMYDIWYAQLENKLYRIGTNEAPAFTGRGGFVEFHIEMVKQTNKDRKPETIFKELWTKSQKN